MLTYAVFFFLTDDYLIFTRVICSINKNAVLKQMYLQYLYILRQKNKQKSGKIHTKITADANKPKNSLEKPGKAHTKIGADAKQPKKSKDMLRKTKKNTYTNRCGRQKKQEKPRKASIFMLFPYIIQV